MALSSCLPRARTHSHLHRQPLWTAVSPVACLWPSPSLVTLKSAEIISSRARAVACGLLAVASLWDAVVCARCHSRCGLGFWLHLLGGVFAPGIGAHFLLPVRRELTPNRCSRVLCTSVLKPRRGRDLAARQRGNSCSVIVLGWKVLIQGQTEPFSPGAVIRGAWQGW